MSRIVPDRLASTVPKSLVSTVTDGERSRHVGGQPHVDLAGVVSWPPASGPQGCVEDGLVGAGDARCLREGVGELGGLRLIAAQRADGNAGLRRCPGGLGQRQLIGGQDRDCLVIGIECPAPGLRACCPHHGQQRPDADDRGDVLAQRPDRQLLDPRGPAQRAAGPAGALHRDQLAVARGQDQLGRAARGCALKVQSGPEQPPVERIQPGSSQRPGLAAGCDAEPGAGDLGEAADRGVRTVGRG